MSLEFEKSILRGVWKVFQYAAFVAFTTHIIKWAWTREVPWQ